MGAENWPIILSQSFFTPENEKVAAFRFVAYTPYFNDGDPCSFGVGDLEYITHNELSEFESEEDSIVGRVRDYLAEDCELPGYIWSSDSGPGIAKSAKEFTKLPDDLIEAVLGEHISVIITRDGVTVDEYEHE